MYQIITKQFLNKGSNLKQIIYFFSLKKTVIACRIFYKRQQENWLLHRK